MALKVMLSSVRRGLADVRDSADPVLKILRYDVIRFESVVKTPVPPRAACVAMVEDCDIYLLLLGEEYGDPMPGTNLAPTEEEWTVARNLGKPTVVFKKTGINPRPEQTAFIKKVEDYETGVWRHSFKDAADLISQLDGAMSVAAEAMQPAVSTPLASPVTVPWLEAERGVYSIGRIADELQGNLAIHVAAVGRPDLSGSAVAKKSSALVSNRKQDGIHRG